MHNIESFKHFAARDMPRSTKNSKPASLHSNYNSKMKNKSHIQQLLRQIHFRFEQKYKDYRVAFRAFDVNFDGTLEFHEFVNGLEVSGISMPLEDYRLLYDSLNYDNGPTLDFNKFCLINTDKSNDIMKSIEEHQVNK